MLKVTDQGFKDKSFSVKITLSEHLTVMPS